MSLTGWKLARAARRDGAESTTITTITRRCCSRLGRLERSRSSRNKRRPHTRARACARSPSTDLPFLFYPCRAAEFLALPLFFIFAHLKLSPRSLLSTKTSRALVLSFLTFCCRDLQSEKRQKILRGYVRNQLEDQRGHRHLWPGFP